MEITMSDVKDNCRVFGVFSNNGCPVYEMLGRRLSTGQDLIDAFFRNCADCFSPLEREKRFYFSNIFT